MLNNQRVIKLNHHLMGFFMGLNHQWALLAISGCWNLEKS
jgi:hypothetical protein